MKKTEVFLDRIYPYILTTGGALGLWAALSLSIERVLTLTNPKFIPACDFNPIISCGPAMSSAQGSVLGFPNPYLGLIGFSAVLVVGAGIFAGAKFAQWYWCLFWLGTLAGFIFIHWLFFQSIYNLNILCPYCVLVYIVTGPIFWYTTLALWRKRHLGLVENRTLQFLQNNHFTVLMLWYLLLVGLATSHFWYYIETIL